jgi:hypothetical protein
VPGFLDVIPFQSLDVAIFVVLHPNTIIYTDYRVQYVDIHMSTPTGNQNTGMEKKSHFFAATF